MASDTSTAKKRFKLIDAVLAVICVIFVAEAVAPAAAIGNAQYFWWIFLIITFLLPYGLVVSELGSTYDDEGGLYDWVRRAFGDAWASRVAYWYWVNFPLWMASLAVAFAENLALVLGVEINIWVLMVIELAFVWGVTFIAFSKVSDAAWIMNVCAVLKVAIAVVLACLGIYFVVTRGFANDMAPATFLPSFDADGLTYLSIILFNFMGFEVIATFAGDMENPQREIPKAILVGGVVIAALYLLGAFGIGSAVPIDELTLDSGIYDAAIAVLGEASPLVNLIIIVFMVTLIGNMVSWSFGVNYVADRAAQNQNMPRPFAIESKKNEMPNGAAVINGIVASILIVLQPILTSLGWDGFFWIFFSMNVVFLLLSYIPMFPAFLKLRQVDGERERVFSVPGGAVVKQICTWLPLVLLVLAIIATIVPLNTTPEEVEFKLPQLIGVIVFLIIGEILRVASKRGRKEDYLGMGRTPGLYDGTGVDMPGSEPPADMASDATIDN